MAGDDNSKNDSGSGGNSEGIKPVANIDHKEDEEGEWIFDSGCTEYITYLSDILVNKKSTHFEAHVVIPNGDSILVKRKGDYILSVGTKLVTMVNPNSNSNSNQNHSQDFNAQNVVNDPLHIASSDHPGMMLTTTSFNVSNFLGWSRTIKMALGVKLKLGFIDGSSPKPAVINGDYQRELSKVSQGSSTVAAYFNKLKKFWDELHSLNRIPVCSCGKLRECTCGVTEKFLETDTRVLKKPIKIRFPDRTSKCLKKEIDSNSKSYCCFPSYHVCFSVLAVGQGFHNLYICKPSSYTSIRVPSILALSSFVSKEAHLYNVTLDLFHARLGHTSVSELIHVLDCKHHNTTHFFM
nr:hypothetical protein [Tanacetum cinerariifolium]